MDMVRRERDGLSLGRLAFFWDGVGNHHDIRLLLASLLLLIDYIFCFFSSTNVLSSSLS